MTRLPRRLRRRLRPGLTLVEMIVVISIVSTVLASASLTLHLLWRLQERRRNEAAAIEALSRLSVQFRADAHQAIRAEPRRIDDAAPEGIALTLPDNTEVAYQPQESVVHRIASRDGQQSHRDLFRLAATARVSVRVADGEDGPSAILEIARQSDAPEPEVISRPWVRIEAAVGLHGGRDQRSPPEEPTPDE